ncbi:hypothetical protein [Viridibacillus arvi]|uniref:Uncharacterized protein n=1 Tax=Viridibacillus arvi TaxID=263475 RepID=A0A0M0L9H2_9BACL|nr:hypothetical protein [Viridibacillus arvi]KOO47746.1 hypothetical protein AMD00_19090 [Viridibacillus arvi]
MNTTTYTLSEVINIEGDEKLLAHFKKNGRLQTNVFNRFVRDLNQKYEYVSVEGKGGKKTKITIGGKRDTLVPREDNRKDNGKGQKPIEIETFFPIIILNHLINFEVSEPQTTNNWLKMMGVITEQMYETNKFKYSEVAFDKEIELLSDNNIIDSKDKYVLKEFNKNESQRINRYFLDSVGDLEESNIINHNISYKAKCTLPDKSEKYIDISDKVKKYADTLKTELLNSAKYDSLMPADLNNLRNKPLVIQFNTEYSKVLKNITDDNNKKLYIDFIYAVHSLELIDKDYTVQQWIEKHIHNDLSEYVENPSIYYNIHKQQFHKAHKQKVQSLAENRQINFIYKETSVFGGKVNIEKYRNSTYQRVQYLKGAETYVITYEKLLNHYFY